MPRICQLDAAVVNKIAAGEVIERPASVVKELLENSIDALATRIEIDVEQGGMELIRVADDGEGIHPDDLPLTVASHATSKIRAAEDLFGVQTLGFRGEALASIAAVSRFRIRSRLHDRSEGTELTVDSGRLDGPRPCGCPPGTTIEISGLFHNTPVRRKFLKTTATEFGHVSEQFTRIALAHPRLHLVLRHNGKVVYELPATNELPERLRLFFGAELADRLIPVDSATSPIRVWGYVAHPSQTKPTRKGQYLFLNGRSIQDRSLGHALNEGYRGLVMVGRHPIAFLFLEMPPEQVDVNVHPTKAEVRFRDSQQLYRQLLSTLRTKFLGMDLQTPFQVPSTPSVPPQPPDPARQRELQMDFADWAKAQLPLAAARVDDGEEASRDDAVDDMAPETVPVPPASIPSDPLDVPPTMPADMQDDANHVARPHFAARAMQIHDAYLVVESDDGLTVIDQHALHERILYEQLRKRVLAGSVESQKLLVPQAIECSPHEAALLLEHRDELAQLGFGLEEFGKNTLLVSSYPAQLERVDVGRLVRDLAAQLEASDEKPTRRDLLDGLLHMLSCKAAIKAGHRLSPEEIDSLLAQRHLVDDAHHCPHGRPTALTLSREMLDRQFGRLG